MKIELSENKVFFENDGTKKEIHPFWLRERVNGTSSDDVDVRRTPHSGAPALPSHPSSGAGNDATLPLRPHARLAKTKGFDDGFCSKHDAGAGSQHTLAMMRERWVIGR